MVPPVQVAAAAKKPVVLVTMTAVPLDLSDILANPKVGTKKHHHSHSNGPFFLLGWREVREVWRSWSGFAGFACYFVVG